MTYYLTVRLHSDTTIGRGEGLAGLVDVEIDHDELGCPFISGRSLKGLLREECANLRFALGDEAWKKTWQPAEYRLFGDTGAMLNVQKSTIQSDAAEMHIGSAALPPDLHAALQRNVQHKTLHPHQILASLTTIRRQTSIEAATGSPDKGSLRSIRVLLRETPLIAALDFDVEPDDERILALLAACVLAARRTGTGRNRGRGRLTLFLHEQLPEDYWDACFTRRWFDCFAAKVQQ